MIVPAPMLSVIVTSCNQLNHLKFTLLALKDQSPDVLTETIVVDCGSTDGTDQFLANQAEKGALRAILETGNEGRTAARNRGAWAANGRYLVFLDPGMIVAPRWWQSIVETLDMDPDIGAVGGKILLTDGRIDHAGLALIHRQERSTPQLMGRSLAAGKPANDPGSNRSTHVQALTSEGLAVRASSFFTVNGFAVELGAGHGVLRSDGVGEPAGMDLCLRLAQRGWKSIYRYEWIMTRLRDGDPADQTVIQDAFTRAWQGQITPDFIMTAEAGAVPAERGFIRPYVVPSLSFATDQAAGRVARGGKVRASVVVVTDNNLDHTRQCVAALMQNTDDRHELIFVDNASTDGTAEFLADRTAGNANCRFIPSQKDLGFAGAHNLGMATAVGKYIVLLSSDVVVTDQWLERLMYAAERNPRAGLLGPVTNNHAARQRLGGVSYDTKSLFDLEDFAADLAKQHINRVDPVPHLQAFCLLIKRELVARIGGMDEVFRHGNFEDNDYCVRARLAGYEAMIVRDCFVHNMGSRKFAVWAVDSARQIRQQWTLFKAKWGIARETRFNAQMDPGVLQTIGFDPARHFHRLPDAGQAPTHTIVESLARE